MLLRADAEGKIVARAVRNKIVTVTTCCCCELISADPINLSVQMTLTSCIRKEHTARATLIALFIWCHPGGVFKYDTVYYIFSLEYMMYLY